jgi:hypothetical protein
MGHASSVLFEPPIAFVAHAGEPPALELRINFGVFAGREATPAEIDELAQILLEATPNVSIVAENRHEISQESEAALHQVRVEFPADVLPDDFVLLDDFERRLVAAAERWARACFDDRHVDIEAR